MRIERLAFLMLMLLPAILHGQTKEELAKKMSNDRPDRPLQMSPASSEVKEAFDEYERFRKRSAWERALKSLYTIPDQQSMRFVDGKNGFIIPVARKRREVLGELPTEGQVAYRLFYDDEAKKLLDQAEGASELNTLERIFSSYFQTSIGDNAADRLGDLYFEMGRFDKAADCWLAVLKEHPDSELSPALISVKAALALSHAARRSEIIALRRDLSERYAGENVSIGGQTATAEEHLRKYLGQDGASIENTHTPIPVASPTRAGEQSPDLSHSVPAVWQMKFGESIVAGMTPPERTQWDSNPLSSAVPAVTVEGTTLYANFLGYVFAINLTSGKLIWRSESFHNVEIAAMQGQVRSINPARFAIMASKRHIWTLGRSLKDPNPMGPFRLTCRRAERGDIVWQTSDLPDYTLVDLVGTPILAGETIYVVGKTPMQMQQQGPPHQYVMAVRAHDGKLTWKTEIGMFRQGQRFFYYGMGDTSPLPRLFYQAGSLFVDTHEGVLARLDATTGELDWGYGYETEPVESNGGFFFFGYNQPKEVVSSSVPFRSGNALFIKGVKSERLCALDPDQMRLIWERPIAKSARLLGANENTVFLGGPEISAVDRKTRSLLWATRVPGGSGEGRVLVRPGGLWQLTPRGIFELDLNTGQVRRIFRGDDTGSEGGDLYLTDNLLLAVSNRNISAYSIAAPAAGKPGELGEGPAATKTRASDD